MKRSLLLAALLVGLSSCGGGSNPLAPSNFVQIAGNWSGTSESKEYVPDAVYFSLTQTGASVTGTWYSSVEAGSISGTVDKNYFNGTITYSYLQHAQCQGSFYGSTSSTNLTWSSLGYTGNCGLSFPGNPTNVKFILQKR